MIALFLAGAVVFSPARSYSQEVSESSRKVLNRASPECPEIARRMRIAGVVKAEVLVSPNGTVKIVEIKGGRKPLALPDASTRCPSFQRLSFQRLDRLSRRESAWIPRVGRR